MLVEPNEERFSPIELVDENTTRQWLVKSIVDSVGPSKKLKTENNTEEKMTPKKKEIKGQIMDIKGQRRRR